MPSAAWWVGTPEVEIARGASGLAVRSGRRVRATGATRYDLASLTKPLVTALLAVLAEQRGLWDLEDPAGRWVPELRGSPYAQASLVALGSHRAGLPAWFPLYARARDIEGYLRVIATLPPGCPPGLECYSDLGYIVLGAALERAAGVRLDELFRDWIQRPLGLSATGYLERRSQRAVAATERGNRYERKLAAEEGRGYRFRTAMIRGEVHDVNAHRLGGVAGHAGLFGTAGEVARLAREILRPTVLPLALESRRLLLEPRAPQGAHTFGFVLARASRAARGVLPDDAPGHTGFTGTSLWIDPPAARIYVLLTNRVHPRVQAADFQLVRRAFHRLAARLPSGR